MSSADQKAQARKDAFQRRKLADPSVTAEANRILFEAIHALPAGRVAGYWPIRTEIDPRPTLVRLTDTREICLPVVRMRGEPLVFRPWKLGAAMIEGAFGTAIPADVSTVVPSVLIVPLVAFSSDGFRLGYGGGFYDRTLEALRRSTPVHAIGFAYQAQGVENLPLEPTDQPLDMIVTEYGVHAV